MHKTIASHLSSSLLEKTVRNECANCLMNSCVDSNIQFDQNGICNYCTAYYKTHNKHDLLIKQGHFQSQISKIKQSKRQKYDCILGISGGTDSSYVAYLLYKEGLNVLLVHCDNGWDREMAISNLEKIKHKTGFDLIVRKIDSKEFCTAQISLLKARVVDIELLSDHVNMASIYELANEKNISWIITGENINTEFFMPKHWVHNKNDWRHITSINNCFEKADLASFPKLGPIRKFFIQKKLKTKYFKPLNYINYNKEQASLVLKREFDWEDHGGKHFESYFTIFYQCHILPHFFNIDKRIAHLSNLICAKILSKEKAKKLISKDILKTDFLEKTKQHVFSKLQLSESHFNAIMAKPMRTHAQYKSHFIYNKHIQKILRALR